MDIDQPDEAQPSTSQSRGRGTVPIDDAHPFELETYIANYSGVQPLSNAYTRH